MHQLARFLYNSLLYLALPFLLLRAWRRTRHTPFAHERLRERLACASLRLPHCLWIHAVSVGEVLAAKPLIDALLDQQNPQPLLVTTTTLTGSERVQALWGTRVYHVYAPYDCSGLIQRFLKQVQPRLIVLMETELWPNLIHYAHQARIPLLVANARLSARSANGYAKLQVLTRDMLQKITQVAAQAEPDGVRFCELGLDPERLMVTGSLKFELKIDGAVRRAAEKIRQTWGARPVWIAASTHSGEESLMLSVHRRLLAFNPQLLLILVPRHPERFDAVATQIEQANFRLRRHSRKQPVQADTQVLLVDSMGELLTFYGTADIAVVGGSFVPVGGHNVLEPIALNKPTIVGSHTFNFHTMVEALLAVEGVLQVTDEEALFHALQRLLTDTTLKTQLTTQAMAFFNQNQGVLPQLLTAIEVLLKNQPLKKTR